ncbi:hypothetical protein B0F90DRAFT_1819762 [Multifurca ochricompacta]|uniref:ubiquitinyl hydrolase 1 n=1 Tax=Multifurca ochricompacta TaxID=376703 RepID=A0AAD4LZJ8_9AGAM|nr:hypothetical protein B0F90DRAFT_1819762 [Multifurca ochricompacta]
MFFTNYMPTSATDIDSGVLRTVIENVFVPPKIPQKAQSVEAELGTNTALCHTLIQAASAFNKLLSPDQQLEWVHMIKMIFFALQVAKGSLSEMDLQQILSNLAVGGKFAHTTLDVTSTAQIDFPDVFVMHVRAQNAAVVVRKFIDFVRFEMFEVSAPSNIVMSTQRKLLCSYPGPAIQIPAEIFATKRFLRELASFLVQMDIDVLDSAAVSIKAGSTVREVREAAHPRYITELLVGILRGFGQPAVVDRITKRIGDEVLWKDAYKPWRRSPLWLIIRVTLQTSLGHSHMYKHFMLFYHAYLLQICTRRTEFQSELLYTMRVKMARRLAKIGSAVSEDVYKAVYSAAEETEEVLQKRWTTFQKRMSLAPSWSPTELDFVADTAITLDNSRSYLMKALRPPSRNFSLNIFTPSHQQRLSDTWDFALFSGGRLTKAIGLDQCTALADFELSVENYLDSWVASSKDKDGTPDVIASCIEQYFSGAKKHYKDYPEDNSIMILTIMDLWKALDTVTVQQCPLLLSYSPEIPRDFLHPLLLHRSGSLRRAMLIEEYICRRHDGASCATSVFSDKSIQSSFGVQYFRDSARLQRLYDNINQHASQEQNRKRDELSRLNEQWQSLKNEASRMSHSYSEDKLGNLIHRRCKKCRTDNKANGLKIDVHEWPLPRAEAEAHNVDQPKLLLGAYSGLKNWVVRHAYHRITIGSTTKSFTDQTHYRKVQIPADVSLVLVNNGLKFRLFDRNSLSWAAGPFPGSNATSYVKPPAPISGPYSKLHSFVCGTQHTSNESIASQADCPKELSIHEYVAFSALRSGPRLQWLNIARELASPSLSFRREEVHTLITQAAWQLGPLTNGVREWHADLGVPEFGRTLLKELEALLERVEANWLEEVTVRTVALATSRLLSSSQDPDICKQACALLRKARSITHKWIGEIASKLDTMEDETSRANLRLRLCVLAATCLSTFDVCLEHVPNILSTNDDFAIAVQCAVMVHDNTPSTVSLSGFYHLIRSLNRHHRLLRFLEPFLRQGVRSHPEGFDLALASLWLAFRQAISSWRVLSAPNSRWISCIAEGGHVVHCNILTGQLLVGGKPLGKLPQEIIQHPTYAGVLGTRVLDVVPADIPGMEFMTRLTVFGYQILFSLHNGDLIMQARRPGGSQLLQFVPRAVFADDFPKTFVEDYYHWLDLSTAEVEFRPAASPWTSDPSNWRLRVRRGPSKSHHAMRRKISGDSAFIDLIDIRSATFKMISQLLFALESPENIIITRSPKTLEASLHRLRLAFFVNQSSEVECRSMPGYIIDEDQSSGTMFGLRNQLVLCHSSGASELPRRVIIPEGDISFTLDGNFANVSVQTGTESHVRWHEYSIDTDLGRLIGSVSLLASYTSATYMRSRVTVYPTRCLGTPERGSLWMLRSAAFKSFQRLGDYDEDAKLLGLISDLTPRRVYYPPHIKSMATVEWANLPALSQHHDFHMAVRSILDHAHAIEALHKEPVTFAISERDESLLHRTAFRNQVFYPQELQNSRQPPLRVPDDVIYKSRDIVDGNSPEHAAYQMSWSAWNDKPSPSRKWLKMWPAIQSWGSIGPASSEISLAYSRYWLGFDAAQDLLGIYNACQQSLSSNSQDTRITLAFSLSAASFSRSAYADFLPLILIFATDIRFRGLRPPHESVYTLSDGTSPESGRSKALIVSCAHPMENTPAQTMEVQAIGKKKVSKQRRQEYNRIIEERASAAASSVISQWPGYVHLNLPRQWFDTLSCREHIEAYLHSISRNGELKNHIGQLQGILSGYGSITFPGPPYTFSPRLDVGSFKTISYSMREVLVSRANVPPPPTCEEHIVIPSNMTVEAGSRPQPAGEGRLRNLIQEFRHSRESLLQLYGDDLEDSHSALVGKKVPYLTQRVIPSYEVLRDHRDMCSERKDTIFSELFMPLKPSEKIEKVISAAGLWPRITPRSILRELSRDRVHALAGLWKHAVTTYAVAFLRYQQSQRLLELSSRGRDEELLRESDTACEEVAAVCSDDWLLIQIDANFLARPLQLNIAHEMISPSSGRSASLQLNMGEGKSSVIVPLVAATLANGSRLVRIVTLKPLSNQMFQLLLSRLSGLADRPIFYIPFSRDLKMTASLVQNIIALYRRCVTEGGVLVIQPEHILSQKLMCIDFLLGTRNDDKKLPITLNLKSLQDWLAKVSRDVLDESDEILHVRYQLVYTAGEQRPVEDHPNRWFTTQQVFSRLRAHSAQLHANFPKMFELDQTHKGFPTMRILDREVSREISSLVVDDALGGALSSLPLAVLSPQIREATRRFIIQRNVSDEDHDLILSHCAGTTLWCGILLLRGLLVDGEGILGYVLKERRWRVDYGLDPGRTPLAVPYRAKDVPSLRAEFGHPDVAIALTCLSYYYGGLTKEQVLLCFDLITKLDNPEMEYDQWVESGNDLPATLRQLNGVNTKDDTQVDEFLVPLFSRNIRMVDFYLSQVVFPRAAKEFPSKLSTSAWDLVEDKTNLTTGFSGTNDNRYLLPTSISQEDPVSQLSTNALVLQYLLQPENNHYECTEGENGERESAKAFLQRLVNQDPEIRVLLDVGAQMLELQNKELVRHWLSLRPDVLAAIFFNDSDHLTVLTQDGTTESFISSPFNRQLDKCIIYLDDAHTRGTDLKLPRETRAAVTLGPKVTKDRLLQGEHYYFIGMSETDNEGRVYADAPTGERTVGDVLRARRVLDILRWAMHETCEDIRHHLPHWAEQGLDHHKRFAAYRLYGSTRNLGTLEGTWLQPESRTLEEMYDPVLDVHSAVTGSEINGIPSLRERIERLGVRKLADVRMAEEQEREVNHEVERERQVERPPKVHPAQHIIRDDIRTLFIQGYSQNLRGEWSPSPLATTDFAATTTKSNGSDLTDYLRPINWVLSSGSGKNSTVIVISPHEANELLPDIRKSKTVRLHIYAPRVTASMRSFSDLAFYSIPALQTGSWLSPAHVRTELNLFSGQLYFDNRREYERICALLALHMVHPGAEQIEVDGFVPPKYRTGESSPFTTSKIALFKKLIGLRRKGMTYGGTDLGRVLDARPLGSDFA